MHIIAVLMSAKGNMGGFVKAIAAGLIIEGPLMHIFLIEFDKKKYGAVRFSVKFIGGIFSVISAFLLAGVVLSGSVSLKYLLAVGIILIFAAIGIGIWGAGVNNLKIARADCTYPVWATCIGLDTMNAKMSVFNQPDNIRMVNNVVARTTVARPIWEFQFNGECFRAVPEQYESQLQINQGQRSRIYINPDNPQQIYCEENSGARTLINIGKLWTALTAVMGVFVIIIFALVL